MNAFEWEEVAIISKGKTVCWKVVTTKSVEAKVNMFENDQNARLFDDSFSSNSKILWS